MITSEYNILSDIGADDGEIFHEILIPGKYKEETLDIGVNLGISYNLTENFLIDGKVNTGVISIGKVSKEIYTGSDSDKLNENIYDLKNRGIVFSIAYLF